MPAIWRSRWSTFSLAFGLCVVAVVAHQIGRHVLGRSILPIGSWWPAAGVALVMMVRLRRQWWPLILTGVVVTGVVNDLLAGASMAQTAVLVTANVVEILTALVLLVGLRPWVRVAPRTLPHGLRLVGAVVAGTVSCTVLVGLYYTLTRDYGWPATRIYRGCRGLSLMMAVPLKGFFGTKLAGFTVGGNSSGVASSSICFTSAKPPALDFSASSLILPRKVSRLARSDRAFKISRPSKASLA